MTINLKFQWLHSLSLRRRGRRLFFGGGQFQGFTACRYEDWLSPFLLTALPVSMASQPVVTKTSRPGDHDHQPQVSMASQPVVTKTRAPSILWWRAVSRLHSLSLRRLSEPGYGVVCMFQWLHSLSLRRRWYRTDYGAIDVSMASQPVVTKTLVARTTLFVGCFNGFTACRYEDAGSSNDFVCGLFQWLHSLSLRRRVRDNHQYRHMFQWLHSLSLRRQARLFGASWKRFQWLHSLSLRRLYEAGKETDVLVSMASQPVVTKTPRMLYSVFADCFNGFTACRYEDPRGGCIR